VKRRNWANFHQRGEKTKKKTKRRSKHAEKRGSASLQQARSRQQAIK
jgi:hypothetical protein